MRSNDSLKTLMQSNCFFAGTSFHSYSSSSSYKYLDASILGFSNLSSKNSDHDLIVKNKTEKKTIKYMAYFKSLLLHVYFKT